MRPAALQQSVNHFHPRVECAPRATRLGGERPKSKRFASFSILYKRGERCANTGTERDTHAYAEALAVTVPGEYAQRTAAPEGGARAAWRQWVRGCLTLIFTATMAAAQDVPSGQPVTLDEVLIEAVGAEDWLRFRFLAPGLTPEVARDFATLQADIDTLCTEVALPYLQEFALAPDVLVISLMDRPVPFGAAAPDALQVFEMYRVESGACLWQEF